MDLAHQTRLGRGPASPRGYREWSCSRASFPLGKEVLESFGAVKASGEGKYWPKPLCWSLSAGMSWEVGGDSGWVTLS